MTRARFGWIVTALILPVILVAACNGDDSPEATATATPTLTATSTPAPTTSPTGTATPEPTATPSLEPNGVLLLDLSAGDTRTLYTGESFPFTLGFEDDGGLWIAVSGENRSLHFAGDGTLIEEIEGYHTGGEPQCHPIESDEPRAEIEGEEYPVHCGVFSPDGRRMLYHIDVPESDWPQGGYAAWLLELATGETTLLTDELRHCGGCDGFAGPAWSPTSRYVMFGETGGDQVFIADAETGTARRIPAEGWGTQRGYQPRWSPAADALLVPDSEGNTLLEFPGTGDVVSIDLPWPARFDATGAFVYSHAIAGEPHRYGPTTSIADAATGEVTAIWYGRPPYVWPDERGVTAVNGEPAALLEGCNELKDECDPAEPCPGGTAIYHPDLDEPHCLEETFGAEWSPDRTRVAAARRTTADDIPYPPPFSESWEIILYDLESGAERVLVSDIRPPRGEAPQIHWNSDGTRILVQWPRASGI